MAYVSVDKNKTEWVYENKPIRSKRADEDCWDSKSNDRIVEIPKGSIEKLIGRKLTWEDEPVKLEEVK